MTAYSRRARRRRLGARLDPDGYAEWLAETMSTAEATLSLLDVEAMLTPAGLDRRHDPERIYRCLSPAPF